MSLLLFCLTKIYEPLLIVVKISPKVCKCWYVYDSSEEQLDTLMRFKEYFYFKQTIKGYNGNCLLAYTAELPLHPYAHHHGHCKHLTLNIKQLITLRYVMISCGDKSQYKFDKSIKNCDYQAM